MSRITTVFSWLSIDFGGDVIFILWFWWLPPFVTIESTTYEARKADIDQYPSRRLKFVRFWPRVEKISRKDYEKTREELFPKTPLTRRRRWEIFPGPGWAVVIRNKRVATLRTLNGTAEGIDKFRREYIASRDANNIMLGLLAAIGAAALAVPGIETTHWIARAFWIGSTVIAVCGVLVGGLTPGLFQLFFGDDMEQFENENESRGVDRDKMLTLKTEPVLVHRIDTLFGLPTLAITFSGALFIAGAFAFVSTVDFAANARSYSRTSWAGLIVVSMAPSVLYMCNFWGMMIGCSIQHRRFREEMLEDSEDSELNGGARSARGSSSHDALHPRMNLGDAESLSPRGGRQTHQELPRFNGAEG